MSSYMACYTLALIYVLCAIVCTHFYVVSAEVSGHECFHARGWTTCCFCDMQWTCATNYSCPLPPTTTASPVTTAPPNVLPDTINSKFFFFLSLLLISVVSLFAVMLCTYCTSCWEWLKRLRPRLRITSFSGPDILDPGEGVPLLSYLSSGDTPRTCCVDLTTYTVESSQL